MKKIIIGFLSGFLCLLTVAAYSQPNNFPQQVSSHFKNAYPNAKVTEWDRERDGFEVEFELNGSELTAYYDLNHNWLRTERDVKRNDVPQAVWDALAKSAYADWKIDDIEEHQTPTHKLVYEIEVKKSGQKSYVYMLPTGRMVE